MVLSSSSVQALHDYGSSWRYFNRQVVWVSLGALVLVGALRVDYRQWRRITVPLLLLSYALLVLVLVPGLGVTVNGSTSWLGMGELRFQPAELVKLALLLYACDLLTRRSHRVDDVRYTVGPVVLVLSGAVFLMMLQPDLGTALVTVAVVFSVLFVAGTPLLPLAGLLLVGTGAAVALSFSAGYRRARLLAFVDPWKDPLNTGYQTVQSLVGLASGGISGVGLGASRAKWGFLPHAHTDFIFAIIGEELGLVGALIVVALFVAFGVVGVGVAMAAPDRFGMLLAAGITAWILVQAFVNMGAVVGVLPITGLTLPFVSFGGSSVLVSMAAAGMLLNVARRGRARR
ncbi:MAG: putative lipid II flippase FtsW [Acidimicrobiales bacterium]|nr:putative lipid II flippase FtsW [Acidimicrobiales bacterium]